MIAVDTNILVYAHRKDSPWHEAAYARLAEIAGSRAAWAIPWPCIHEFIAISTHPRIYNPPTPLAAALNQVEAWLEAPGLMLLAETGTYWRQLRTTLTDSRIMGPQVHDAKIAVLCHLHGVRELWTADRDFGRFPELNATNPLLG